MHDYKNQIRTIQVLLKKGDTQAAAALAERLTESISVEMAYLPIDFMKRQIVCRPGLAQKY